MLDKRTSTRAIQFHYSELSLKTHCYAQIYAYSVRFQIDSAPGGAQVNSKFYLRSTTETICRTRGDPDSRFRTDKVPGLVYRRS